MAEYIWIDFIRTDIIAFVKIFLGDFYKGITSNLTKRLKEHNSGKNYLFLGSSAVERVPVKNKVVGSNPTRGANLPQTKLRTRAKILCNQK